jgi:hypothetical protein
MWTAGWNEPWYEFSERRYEAEKALEAKLRRLPSCELRIDPQGTVVELSLGGIRVISRACLAGACRAWAAEVRRRAGLPVSAAAPA